MEKERKEKINKSFNGKFYSTNNIFYTDKHNNVMDSLLWSYAQYYDNIDFDAVNNNYYPLNEYGVEILEHLANCDLILEVAN